MQKFQKTLSSEFTKNANYTNTLDMDATTSINQNSICIGCLRQNCVDSVQSYDIVNEALKAIFQTESIFLCHLCKRIAQHAESFIQNVQTNQLLLENCHNMTEDFLQTLPVQSLVNLAHTPLVAIDIDAGKQTDKEDCSVSWYGMKHLSYSLDIKKELKEEEQVDDASDDEDFVSAFVKQEEDELSLKELLKGKLEFDSIDIDLKTLNKLQRRPKKKRKHKRRLSSHVKLEKDLDTNKSKCIEIIDISMEQYMEERNCMALDKNYLDRQYKCKDCIKGYSMKSSYETHMELHCKEKGQYQCDICKQYMNSEETLLRHKKNHFIRYRCVVCGLTRNCRITIKDHYDAIHAKHNKYKCLFCSKEFTRPVSLRKHMNYVHKTQERPVCAYCSKSYANKDVIKQHMVIKHPKEVSAEAIAKPHSCSVCDKAFRNPSHLKAHSIKHSEKKDFYCVECDKSFKSDSILKHHLRTTSAHTKYLELPLSCETCGKRFAIRRDLDRHVNRMHLNFKPYECDKCDKAYVNGYSLTQHQRLSHEGYKKPFKYPCKVCAKVFNVNATLKAHMRTHTGERPYQCSVCPASFSQSGSLKTHFKLIHMKLTRDGRPKMKA